jgi:uncharacterized protein YukE
MSRLAVDLELLDELLAALAVAERSLGAVREEVDHSVGRTQAAWRGAAAQAQASAQQQWAAGEVEMRAGLARLRDVAAGAAGNYRAAVDANRAIWGR